MRQLVAGGQLGAYQLLEKVGRGGMAEVWKALQPSLSRVVAIKVLPEFLAEEAGFRERFKSEATTIARLRHPNVLAVFDYGEHDGIAYIVSEFIEGGTLSDRLGSALPVSEVVRLLTPIAGALDYAHGQGIVHRDLKPSNVLLTANGDPVLSDFGLAKMLDDGSRLTRTGTAVGTPQYMSPEQAAGEPAGPASDRYALAVMAYELLTGSLPFDAETPLATLLAHLHKPLPLPRERNPQLSAAVETALLKGLAKRPEDRFASAVQMLQAIAQGDRAGTAPVPAALAATPAARRSPLLVVGLVALVLLAGGIGLRALGGQRPAVSAPEHSASAPVVNHGSETAPESARPSGPLPPRPSSSGALPQRPSPSIVAPAIEGLGQMVWTARMEDRELAMVEGQPAGQAEVRMQGGALELELRSVQAHAVAVFRRPVPNEYVAEMDIAFGEDFPMTLVLLRRGAQAQYALVVEPRGQVYLTRMDNDQRSAPEPRGEIARISPPGGRSVRLAIAVGEQDVTVLAGGKKILAESLELEEGEDATAPMIGFAVGGDKGQVRVTGLRIFEYTP